MSEFLKSLRREYEEEGRIPKMDLEAVKRIVEKEWVEFIKEDCMQPEGATMRILSEHSFLEDKIFFLKAVTTLITLNLNQHSIHLPTINYLNEEAEKVRTLIGETTLSDLVRKGEFSSDELAKKKYGF